MPVGAPFPLLGAIAIQDTYVDAVDRAGGLGAVLAPRHLDAAEADAVITSIDGLVLTGGPDIAPARYGQAPHATTYGVSDLQDHFELALLAAGERNGTPILAICRGLQLLNVARGGTLHQHLPDLQDRDEHGVPAGGAPTLHPITVDPNSLLAQALGVKTPTGACHHHQAVDRLGDGLRVVAWAADGTIEGLEPLHTNQWLVAVQWHPEDTADDDPVQHRLVRALIEQAGLE